MRSKEGQLQSECVKWFRFQYPKLIIYAIANGGSRNVIEATNLKRQGVLAGIPDLCVPIASGGYNALYIEMKYGKGKTTDSQKEMIDKLSGLGNQCEVVRNFDEFKQVIRNYLL